MSYCQIFDKVAQFRSLGTKLARFSQVLWSHVRKKKSKKLQNFQGLFIKINISEQSLHPWLIKG